MKISVLQQRPRYGYNQLTETPSLEYLKEQIALTLEDTFAMLDEAGARGSDLAVTIEGVNMHVMWADMRWPYPELYEGLDGPLVARFAEYARKWKMNVVAGLYLTIDGKTYNCAVLTMKVTLWAFTKRYTCPQGRNTRWLTAIDLRYLTPSLARSLCRFAGICNSPNRPESRPFREPN